MMDERAIYDARLELVDFLIDVFWDTPTEEFVERLLDGDPSFPEGSVNEPLDEGLAMLREWIEQNRGRSPETVQDELSREYTRLFIGPRPPVLPHESYYREDVDFLGDGLSAVEASYGAAGWQPPEDYPEEAYDILLEGSGDEKFDVKYDFRDNSVTYQHTFKGLRGIIREKYEESNSSKQRDKAKADMRRIE
jgi:hypothetical protein